MQYSHDQLKKILQDHVLWLEGSPSGFRANLRNANLCNANLCNANLCNADLSGADLSNADLSGADLSGADLWNANFWNADLWNANLCNADLRNADLWNVTGNNKEIKTVQSGRYVINYTDTAISIGCQTHDINEWWRFTDKEILSMDGKRALRWWKVWKPILKSIIEASPAG